MPFVALDTKVSCGFTGLGNILTFTFQAAEDYMDAEDLFHALRDQFKASSHVVTVVKRNGQLGKASSSIYHCRSATTSS